MGIAKYGIALVIIWFSVVLALVLAFLMALLLSFIPTLPVEVASEAVILVMELLL